MRNAILATVTLVFLMSSASAGAEGRQNSRQGFWVGGGLGVGSTGADCNSCGDDRTSGFSGNLRLGGTISPSFLLGGETNGWVHSETGVDETMGFASIVGIWYPSRTGAFFLKLGLGGMHYSADDGSDQLTATAPSASLGLGYEIRTGRNFSVVPYLNSLATSSVELKFDGHPLPTGEDININLVQIGVGVVWH